jgi:hypothetical protein
MGMYTELEYTVKLKEDEVEKVKEWLNEGIRHDDYVAPWEHIFFEDERWSLVGNDYLIIDGCYLTGRDEIKNYTGTYYKLLCFLETISEKVMLFRTRYEEDCYEDDWDGWEDMLDLPEQTKEYYETYMRR